MGIGHFGLAVADKADSQDICFVPSGSYARLVERLRPLYPKGERGRPPIGLERMLRLYFVQQWYGLADEAVEDALYDSQALRGFAGIDLRWRRCRTRRPCCTSAIGWSSTT